MDNNICRLVLSLLLLTFFSTSVTAVSLSTCQDLNDNHTTYTLTQDISANGSCLTLSNQINVTIDCAGYTISYAGTQNNSNGMDLDSGVDHTVKNCILNQTGSGSNFDIIRAIRLDDLNSSTFSNITINIPDSGDECMGIFFSNDEASGSNENVFDDITITGDAGQLVYIKIGNSNNFSNSFLNSTTTFDKKAFDDDGDSTYLFNMTIHSVNGSSYGGDTHTGNTVINQSTLHSSAASGIHVNANADGITVEHSTISSSTSSSNAAGFFIWGQTGTVIRHSTISATNTNTLVIFSNDTYVLNTSVSAHGTAALVAGVNGFSHASNTQIINSTFTTNATWFTTSSSSSNTNLSDITFLTNAGSIRLLDSFIIPVSTTGTTSFLNISENSAFLNSSAAPFLNVSGQITLHNVTSTDPQPLVDLETTNTFSTCSSICTEESFSSNTFIFNVSHFTTFSSNESAQDIDNDNIIDSEDPLVGNMSHVVGIPPTELTATIGGSSTITGNVTGVKEFVLRESGNLLLNFSHNFTASAINLSKFTIVHSGAGIVVNLSGQLVGNKTLYVPDTGFTSLCVKDAEVTTISQISASCTGINEYDFTSCLGNTGPTTISGIDCYDQGSLIRVDNLTHSGIRGTGGASISGAAILNEGQSSSFTESTAGSDNAQATNVTEINFSTTASTTKWQGYFGNVEGNLRMGSGSNILYNFGSLPISQIVAVFASTDSNFDFSATTAATAGNVDTVWSFTTADADSGTNVFSDGSATISDVPAVPIANLTAYTSAGTLSTSLYQSGVVTDGGTIGAGEYNSLAFGVNVDANERDFSNSTVIDFELIVPVNGSGQSTTQSYFFFMDIS